MDSWPAIHEVGHGPTVLLWHGRGTDERADLLPLAEAVAAGGRRALVAGWDSAASDGGRGALLTSVRIARETSDDPDAITLVGHSLGGIAAASMCLHQRRLGVGFARVVCLAAAPFPRLDPISGGQLPPATKPVDRGTTVAFVNGIHDDLAPLDSARSTFEEWKSAGWPISFTALDADHDSILTDHTDALADLVVGASAP